MPTADDLRRALRVGADVSDAELQGCLDVATAAAEQWVPAENRTSPLYAEGVLGLAVKVWEERGRGRVGMDPSGDVDVYYTPGATAGMIRSQWAYFGPLVPTGGLSV